MQTDTIDTDDVLDLDVVNADIATGARAYRQLLNHKANGWIHWEATIRGLRGLRSLAFAEAHTTDMHSQAYQDAIGRLLMLRKRVVYTWIDNQTRSDCYKLMDGLEKISAWHTTLSITDKLKWKHPSSIAKYWSQEAA